MNEECWTENFILTNNHDNNDDDVTIRCNEDNLMCSEGARGPLCSSCEDGYYYSAADLKCFSCSSSTMSEGEIVSIVLCLFIIISFIFIRFHHIHQIITNNKIFLFLNELRRNGSLTILLATYQIIQSITLSMEISDPIHLTRAFFYQFQLSRD
mmetsp:Transcript_30960/g.39864  ORF Transcript_30960/g.39864 Transcript_30960/m.39864 type:complete len:154 (+) Transcript_30960:1210-1671(+)